MAEKKAVASEKMKSAPKFKRPSIKVPGPLRAIGGYFKGAWYELGQVRWPNRRATWELTLAVILFSVFFAVVILGLDYLFQYLFKEVIL